MQSRYEKALALQESQPEEASREFHLLAAETPDVNWKAALLLNEVRCYANLGRFDDAGRVLEEIGNLAPIDDIRMDVSFVVACVAAQRGEHAKAALQYGRMLQEYADLLSTDENRNFYEDISFRNAIELASSGEHSKAVPFFKEATSFTTLMAEDQQQVHLWLGICYEELRENDLAIQEYLKVIDSNLVNNTNADARYRVARLYFARGGFSQAKHQLETILQDYSEEAMTVPLKYVYEQLSRACHYLGEKENAKRYAMMSKDSKYR